MGTCQLGTVWLDWDQSGDFSLENIDHSRTVRLVLDQDLSNIGPPFLHGNDFANRLGEAHPRTDLIEKVLISPMLAPYLPNHEVGPVCVLERAVPRCDDLIKLGRKILRQVVLDELILEYVAAE